jgi:hypothetical protein
MFERSVEFAVGFVGGQWQEVMITVPEDEDRVLDDGEVEDAARKVIEKIEFAEPVAFYHLLYIGDPEGGFGEDWDH